VTLPRWTPGPVWAGMTVPVVAGGPSVSSRQIDLCRRHIAWGGVAIVVNNAWEALPGATLLWASDKRWWDWPSGQRALSEFAGIKATQDARAAAAYGLKWLECRLNPDVADEEQATSHGGYDPEPGYMRSGRNGGYQAIHLASQLGAAVVPLVGFDMKPAADGRKHWHAEHPSPTRDDVWRKWMLPNFPTLAEPLARIGCRVVNCTPESALTCFECDDLENVL
jgi:hypothetical protein